MRKTDAREDWEQLTLALYNSKRRCQKCGSENLKGYPQEQPIQWVCLECGARYNKTGELVD